MSIGESWAIIGAWFFLVVFVFYGDRWQTRIMNFIIDLREWKSGKKSW